MIESEKQELKRLLTIYQNESEQKMEEWKNKWKETPKEQQVLKECNRRTYITWAAKVKVVRDVKEIIDC